VPRGLTGPSDNAATVERLGQALRAQDAQAVAAELHPEVEATGQKGTFRGIDAVVGWAKPSTDGHLYSRVELDELREVGDYVALAARRQWRWRETDELADEAPFGVLFELRDGKVYRWRQDFDSLIDAVEAIPASPP
jgi:limonene-1,2-epoxide hydrolase